MSNVRIFTRINKSKKVSPSLPPSSEEAPPVINPNPIGRAINHNSTLKKDGGDVDNSFYGHNTENIQEALEGSNLPSDINVFATIEDFNNYVTLNTEQEITGKKIFNADLIVGDPSLDYLGWSKLAKTFGIFSQAQFIHKYRGGAAGALNIGQFDVNGNASINNTSNAGISIGTNNIQRIGIEANGDVLLKKVDNGVGGFLRIDETTGQIKKRTVAEVQAEIGVVSVSPYDLERVSATKNQAITWSEANSRYEPTSLKEIAGVDWRPTNLTKTATYRGFYCICYGKGVFLAGGDDGKVAISSDGANWIFQQTSTTFPIRQIKYGNGLFVAFCSISTSSNELIVTSSDGVNWTTRTSVYSGSNFTFNELFFGKSMFVAVSFSDKKSQYSLDGITWVAGTFPQDIPQYDYSEIEYNNGVFVTSYAYSEDGINWVKPTNYGLSGKIVYFRGLFLSHNNTSGWKSSVDGTDWVNYLVNNTTSASFICQGNGVLIVVSSAQGTTQWRYSFNGIDFYNSLGYSHVTNVCYGNGIFVVIRSPYQSSNYSIVSGNIIDPDVYRLNN